MKSGSDSDRPAAPSTPGADAIPLLTERLYVATLPPVTDDDDAASETGAPAPTLEDQPPAAQDVAHAPAAAEVAAPAAAAAALAIPAGAAVPVADISAVRDAVLDDLERSLPGQIESMIRREVSNAIDDAVFRVVAETQDALARALGQVVERAVRDELTRLRNEDG